MKMLLVHDSRVFRLLSISFMLYYRGCRWGESNSEEFLKWDGGGCGEKG